MDTKRSMQLTTPKPASTESPTTNFDNCKRVYVNQFLQCDNTTVYLPKPDDTSTPKRFSGQALGSTSGISAVNVVPVAKTGTSQPDESDTNEEIRKYEDKNELDTQYDAIYDTEVMSMWKQGILTNTEVRLKWVTDTVKTIKAEAGKKVRQHWNVLITWVRVSLIVCVHIYMCGFLWVCVMAC